MPTGKYEWNFRYVIFKGILVTDSCGISCEIALIWMSLNLTDDQSTLVQVMAWCRQATSHYLSQCWPRSQSPYGVTRPQWLKYNYDRSITHLGWDGQNGHRATRWFLCYWRVCLLTSITPHEGTLRLGIFPVINNNYLWNLPPGTMVIGKVIMRCYHRNKTPGNTGGN